MPWGVTMAVMVVVSVAVALYVAWPLLIGRPETEAESADGDGTSAMDDLLVRKDATYSAIKELEFDHAMGNLSNEDYQELAARYEDKAVALLKTIDEVSQDDLGGAGAIPAVAGVKLGAPRDIPMGDAIERQVAGLRRSRGKAGGRGRNGAMESEIEGEVARLRQRRRQDGVADEVEQQVAALRTSGGASSGRARTAPAPPASPSRRACPACGAAVRSDSAVFCSRCGASLATRCPVCGASTEVGDTFCSGCGTSLAPRDVAGPSPS